MSRRLSSTVCSYRTIWRWLLPMCLLIVSGSLTDPVHAAENSSADVLRIHIISGAKEYQSEGSLKAFRKFLEEAYRIECTASWGHDGIRRLENLEALRDADLMLIFARRMKLVDEQMAEIRRHWEQGKPIVGIRTASHAFQQADNEIFDRMVLGGDYQGHYGDGPVKVTAIEDQANHPVLKGVRDFASDRLYKAGELADGAVVLQRGAIPEAQHPVTWVHTYRGGRMLYTSLGVPSDFQNENFRRMLVNALFWTTNRDPQRMRRSAQAAADRGPVVLTDAARELHRQCLVFDGHNDLPWVMRTKAASSFEQIDISQPQPQFHTDIPRLRQGGVGAQFWSAYPPVSTIAEKSATRYVLEQIDLIHRMARRYPDTFAMAETADDIVRIRKEGKIACLIGVEGGHAIENSLGVLRVFYNLGVRYLTLTHADTIDWADSATDDPRHEGLSPFGEDVVRAMNDLGMLVDISHVSVETMKDALRVSRAPLIASHSSANAVAEHPRNVPDAVLKLVAENGGVVMVNFYSGFVVPESARRMRKMFAVRRELRKQHADDADFARALRQWQRANPIEPGTIHDVIDHIDHIVQVAGVDHVGLGSDYDGVSVLPDQLSDVSTYPYITQALLDRGYQPEEIRKILGGNVLRALREAERIARRK